VKSGHSLPIHSWQTWTQPPSETRKSIQIPHKFAHPPPLSSNTNWRTHLASPRPFYSSPRRPLVYIAAAKQSPRKNHERSLSLVWRAKVYRLRLRLRRRPRAKGSTEKQEHPIHPSCVHVWYCRLAIINYSKRDRQASCRIALTHACLSSCFIAHLDLGTQVACSASRLLSYAIDP
jgi:hypothetical protein